ncbi:hypothetical protein GOP47_0013220 [Adiantum capillus-veneris]|uniref:Uncharacterized protein n=1 Tax=Adiantum capillus-veneris TaxID=13818 RepID=A0A9D4UN47_ADICA|nr:hypothetical protein GOP47_0013220 [Adiantum capillus-veneris]
MRMLRMLDRDVTQKIDALAPAEDTLPGGDWLYNAMHDCANGEYDDGTLVPEPCMAPNAQLGVIEGEGQAVTPIVSGPLCVDEGEECMSEEEWTRKLDAMFPGYVEARYEEELLHATGGNAGHTLLDGKWSACEPCLIDGYGTREKMEEEHQVILADPHSPHERGELEHEACGGLQAAAFELPEKGIVEIRGDKPVACEEVRGNVVKLECGMSVVTPGREVNIKDVSRVRVVIEVRGTARSVLTVMHDDWVTTWAREIRLGMSPKWPYRRNASEKLAEVKPVGSVNAGLRCGCEEQVLVGTYRHGAGDGRTN